MAQYDNVKMAQYENMKMKSQLVKMEGTPAYRSFSNLQIFKLRN